MNDLQQTIASINQLDPLAIVTDPSIRDRWIQIYDTIHGSGSGESAYERESYFFNQKLRDDERLRTASTRFSLFNAFIDLAIQGITMEPGTRAQCYLMGRNVKVGKDASGRDIYEGHAYINISGYGEIYMRQRAGQIRHADNPVIVYEGDTFSFGESNGQKVVNYMCNLPRTSNKIVAAYMRITRADGSTDYAVMTESDWLRLAQYSQRNNRKWDNNARRYVNGDPNELYVSQNGSIDPGFLAAKLIKHAFRSYPKLRVGRSSMLESGIEDQQQVDIDSFYGDIPTEAPADSAAYGNAPDYSAGIRIDPTAQPPSAPVVNQPSAPVASPSSPQASSSDMTNDDPF